MELKQYQTDTLSLLRRFFEEARIAGPKNAYEAITKEPELAGRLGRYGGVYKELASLPNVPYVCLRLPTGGGKPSWELTPFALPATPGSRRTIPWSCGWCRRTPSDGRRRRR